MLDDGTLLRFYAEERDQEAFAELVRRHLEADRTADFGVSDFSQPASFAFGSKAQTLALLFCLRLFDSPPATRRWRNPDATERFRGRPLV